MKELLDFIREFDIHNLLSIAIIFWAITRQWRAEMKEWKNEVKEETAFFRQEMSEQRKRSDKLYEMFYELLKEKK